MRLLSETLTDLIGFAETVITRPTTAVAARLAPLAAEIRHADGLPAENIRTTRAAMIMVCALDEFFIGDRNAGSQWLMLAGTALPLLRGEAWVASRNEKEARGS